jgi:hypothetical protein
MEHGRMAGSITNARELLEYDFKQTECWARSRRHDYARERAFGATA